jgi:hypothetical protein
MFMDSSSPTAPAETAPSAPREGCACCRDAAAERVEREGRVLDEVVELSMALMRAITQQALAHADGQPVIKPLLGGVDPALALSRVARTVRQTLALKAKLAEDRETREKRRDAEAAAAAERERRQRKKAEVKRLVERVIETEAADQFRAEKLLINLHERLEDEDDTAFADRPIALLIAEICRDLPVYFDRDQWVAEIAASEGACAGVTPDAASAAADADQAAETSPSPVAAAGNNPPSIAVPSREESPATENDLAEPVPPQRE